MPEGEQQSSSSTTQGSGKPRKASNYVVFVETKAVIGDAEKRTEVAVARPILAQPNGQLRVFEGFRADDVLDEVVEGDFGVETDEKTGKSDWCYIIPASKVHRMRGSVTVERSVSAERG